MVFLRSKNAKILSMIAAMVVVLIIVYAYVVSAKDEKNKAQDVDIAHIVVDVKSEIEKIREQIQNVE